MFLLFEIYINPLFVVLMSVFLNFSVVCFVCLCVYCFLLPFVKKGGHEFHLTVSHGPQVNLHYAACQGSSWLVGSSRDCVAAVFCKSLFESKNKMMEDLMSTGTNIS